MFLLVLKQLIIMTLIAAAGFAFAKIFKVGQTEQKFLSKLLLYFINPCLIVNSFNEPFDAARIKQLGIVIIISLFVVILMMLISTLFSLSKNAELKDYNTIEKIALVFTNCGFIGIPLIRGVFGDEGVFFLMGYLVIFNITLWTWGYMQMSGKISIKKIIANPNIIAVILGITIYCIPGTLPFFISEPVKMISATNTAIAMVLLGILFADFHFERQYTLRLVKVILIRLVLIPVILVFVLALINLLLKNHADFKMPLLVILICSSCPSATSVPSLSVIFNKNSSYASLIVSLTSLFSIVTIPLVVLLAEHFF